MARHLVAWEPYGAATTSPERAVSRCDQTCYVRVGEYEKRTCWELCPPQVVLTGMLHTCLGLFFPSHETEAIHVSEGSVLQPKNMLVTPWPVEQVSLLHSLREEWEPSGRGAR